MKSARNKAGTSKSRKTRTRTKPPAKFPDFYKELKEIFGDRTFDKELAHYNDAIS